MSANPVLLSRLREFRRTRAQSHKSRRAEMEFREAEVALGFDLLASVAGPIVHQVNKIEVREKSNDWGPRINLYFGGSGQRAGEGHAHYIFSLDFKLEYRREPHQEPGRQNALVDRRFAYKPQVVSLARIKSILTACLILSANEGQ